MIEKQENYEQAREYFSLIEKTGSKNRYQYFLFVIFTFIAIFDSALLFAPPFLFYIANYQCNQEGSDSCTQFVCSLDPAERKEYESIPPFHSLAHDFNVDFQCQNVETITLFSTLVFVGSIGGMLIFTSFSQRIGRKACLCVSLIILIIGLSLTLLSGIYASIPLIILAIILTYCGCDNAYQCVYCFCTQVIAEDWRVSYINLLNAIYGLGIIIDAVAFFYIKEWIYIYAFIFLVPAILTLLAVIFIVEKTPLNLIATETEENIIKSLQRIAKLNGIQFTVTLEEVRSLKQDYNNSLKLAVHKSFTVPDLFSYKSLKKTAIPLMILNFVISYLFYSPSAIKSSLSNDLFKETVIQGFSCSLSSVLVHFFFERIERKKTNLIISFLTLLSLVLLLLQEENKDSIPYVIFYLFYRVSLSLSFFIIYIMNYESFPTQIRGVGATFCSIVGNSSGLVQPSITDAWKRQGWNVLYSFMGICFLGLLPNLFLKETYNIPPPQIIEELQQTCTENESSKDPC